MDIINILVDELNKGNLENEEKGKRQNLEQYEIVTTIYGVFHNPVAKVKEEWKEYKADYEEDNIECITARNDEKALEEAFEFEKQHGILFNLFEIDENFDEIRTIF